MPGWRAIATLGIAEIIIAIMKNEDWLARGVKNVYGIPRPSPVVGYEVDLQNDPAFQRHLSHPEQHQKHDHEQQRITLVNARRLPPG